MFSEFSRDSLDVERILLNSTNLLAGTRGNKIELKIRIESVQLIGQLPWIQSPEL